MSLPRALDWFHFHALIVWGETVPLKHIPHLNSAFENFTHNRFWKQRLPTVDTVTCSGGDDMKTKWFHIWFGSYVQGPWEGSQRLDTAWQWHRSGRTDTVFDGMGEHMGQTLRETGFLGVIVWRLNFVSFLLWFLKICWYYQRVKSILWDVDNFFKQFLFSCCLIIDTATGNCMTSMMLPKACVNPRKETNYGTLTTSIFAIL